MTSASPENAVLEQVLDNFREGLQSKIPLELKHCIDFLDDLKILELATQGETKALKKLLENLSKLEHPDKGRVKVALEQFNSRMEDIIQNEYVSKHMGFKKEAEVFLNGQVDTLHANLKASIESRGPNLDLESLKIFIEEGKQRKISDFEFHWSHANATLFQQQKENLGVMLEELEQEALENRRRQLEPQASASNDETEISVPEVLENEDRMDTDDSGNAHLNQSVDIAIVANIADNDEDSYRERGNVESSDEGMQSSSGRGEKRQREDPPVPAEDGAVSKRPNQEGAAIMPGCSTSGPEVSSNKHDSLIFWPGSYFLKMAMVINGTFKNENSSENENIKWCIHSALGLDEDGKLTSKEDKSLGEFSLSDLVRDRRSERNPISFNAGVDKYGYPISLLQKVNIEFLLGFLLKLQKDSAEIQTERKFDTAILIVPIWLTSPKRIQFKDAALVAGFGKVHLLNEESIEGYLYAFERIKKKCVILVLGKNFGIVSAILYESNGETLNMLADTYFDHALSATDFYAGLENFLSTEVKSLTDNGTGRRKVVFLSGLGYEMDDLLSKVLYGFGFTVNEHGSELSGVDPDRISFLSGRSVQEIRKAIQEYLPSCVGYCQTTNIFERPHYNITKIFDEKPVFPTHIEIKLPLNRFSGEAVPEIVQDFMFANNTNKKIRFYIGKMTYWGREISSKTKNKSSVKLTVDISSDGIVSVNEGSIKLIGCGKFLKFLGKDFQWEPVNLSDPEILFLRHRMRSIFKGKWQ